MTVKRTDEEIREELQLHAQAIGDLLNRMPNPVLAKALFAKEGLSGFRHLRKRRKGAKPNAPSVSPVACAHTPTPEDA